jgi:DNA polymerase
VLREPQVDVRPSEDNRALVKQGTVEESDCSSFDSHELDSQELDKQDTVGPKSKPGAAGLGWAALQQSVSVCTKCSLSETRTQTVFGVGSLQAQWLIIGEAPGADEDRLGEPFVGRAGQLLNNMLLAIGLQREQVFIANILKCRPPNNRDPKPEEVELCEPYLHRQVTLLRPKIILALGRIAAHNLLKTDTSLGQLRGKCYHFTATNSVATKDTATNTPLIVTYHPAYLLRSPREKRKVWQDLLLAKGIAEGVAKGI